MLRTFLYGQESCSLSPSDMRNEVASKELRGPSTAVTIFRIHFEGKNSCYEMQVVPQANILTPNQFEAEQLVEFRYVCFFPRITHRTMSRSSLANDDDNISTVELGPTSFKEKYNNGNQCEDESIV